MQSKTGLTPPDFAGDFWQRFDVREIEDMQNLVLGAQLQTMQMAGQKIGGTVAFSARDGVIFSSGLIAGNVAARGILSDNAITIGIGLGWGKGSRVCLRHIDNGCVGIVLPGDEMDVVFTPGTLYIAAAVTTDGLKESFAQRLQRTGIHPRPLSVSLLKPIRQALLRIHAGDACGHDINVGSSMLQAVEKHYAVSEDTVPDPVPQPHETIVRLGRDYIERHLPAPILISDVAAASGTSLRTFYRAFEDILGETPNRYVRRLRLHRIRRELMSDDWETTVAASNRRWGIREHGRMSGWYRDVFGEQPGVTLANAQQRRRAGMWL